MDAVPRSGPLARLYAASFRHSNRFLPRWFFGASRELPMPAASVAPRAMARRVVVALARGLLIRVAWAAIIVVALGFLRIADGTRSSLPYFVADSFPFLEMLPYAHGPSLLLQALFLFVYALWRLDRYPGRRYSIANLRAAGVAVAWLLRRAPGFLLSLPGACVVLVAAVLFNDFAHLDAAPRFLRAFALDVAFLSVFLAETAVLSVAAIALSEGASALGRRMGCRSWFFEPIRPGSRADLLLLDLRSLLR